MYATKTMGPSTDGDKDELLTEMDSYLSERYD